MTRRDLAIVVFALLLVLAWRMLPRYEVVPMGTNGFVRHDRWTGTVEGPDAQKPWWFN